MSENQQLSYNGHDERDEDSDIPTTKHFNHGDDENDEESSTKQRQNGDNNEIAEAIIKKPQVTTSIIGTPDTFDKPLNITADGSYYAKQESYTSGFDKKSGKWISKVGYFTEAGVGRARAEFSVFEAEAKGSNASFDTEVSTVGAKAMARAEVASASANVGPVGVKVGLGFDTGACVSEDGVEAKFLGTGFSIGQKTSISVLGSEASCSVM